VLKTGECFRGACSGKPLQIALGGGIGARRAGKVADGRDPAAEQEVARLEAAAAKVVETKLMIVTSTSMKNRML
jgi:hypothetical protein